MYARLELNKSTTDPHQDPNKNLRLAQKRYKIDYDLRASFAHTFCVGDYAFLDRPSLFHSAAERSASEVFNKLLPRNEGPYKVISVNDNTVQILQDGLKSTISFQRATISPTSRGYCDDDPADRIEQSSKEEPRSGGKADKNR